MSTSIPQVLWKKEQIVLTGSLVNSKFFLLFMYLSNLFFNMYNNLHCSMVRIFCFYRTASPDIDTPLQTADINKTFDLHIIHLTVYEHQP